MGGTGAVAVSDVAHKVPSLLTGKTPKGMEEESTKNIPLVTRLSVLRLTFSQSEQLLGGPVPWMSDSRLFVPPLASFHSTSRQ